MDPKSKLYQNAYEQYQNARRNIMNTHGDNAGISSALPETGLDLSQWGQPKVAGAN